MSESVTPITNTTVYPVYASKAAFLADLEEASEKRNRAKLREIKYRLSNTDTSNWADPTVRHDA